MRKIFTIICSIVAFATAYAQEQTSGVPFNGLVLDGSGNGISRMRVEVKGTEKRTLTDKQGRFGLTNIEPEDVLVISIKGQDDLLIPIDGRRSLSIKLDGGKLVSAEESQELVEAGFRFIKRRETTPAGVILGEDLRRTNQTDLEAALLSRLPSLSKVNDEIVVRGSNSINSSSKAMIVVDGTEVQSLTSVSIHEIETIEVVKSGSMYGVRGANGVIVIKTRTR
jgi:hypothetical protein